MTPSQPNMSLKDSENNQNQVQTEVTCPTKGESQISSGIISIPHLQKCSQSEEEHPKHTSAWQVDPPSSENKVVPSIYKATSTR